MACGWLTAPPLEDLSCLLILRTQPCFCVLQGEQAQPSNGSSSGGGGAQPAPTHLAVSTNSEHIRLFDCATLGCCATLAGHSDIVLCLDALRVPSGQTLLASGSKDNCVRVWAVPQGSCIGGWVRLLSRPIIST